MFCSGPITTNPLTVLWFLVNRVPPSRAEPPGQWALLYVPCLLLCSQRPNQGRPGRHPVSTCWTKGRSALQQCRRGRRSPWPGGEEARPATAARLGAAPPQEPLNLSALQLCPHVPNESTSTWWGCGEDYREAHEVVVRPCTQVGGSLVLSCWGLWKEPSWWDCKGFPDCLL